MSNSILALLRSKLSLVFLVFFCTSFFLLPFSIEHNSLFSLTAHAQEGDFILPASACKWTDFTTWFAGCMTPAVMSLGGWALWASGLVFDFFISLTLNNAYLEANYISTTWELMRDFANMAFILGIIVVALVMITGADKYTSFKWEDLAFRLVVIALLLNFSLFFSKVIIDAGNITGSFFYNRIIASGAPPAAVQLDDIALFGIGPQDQDLRSVSAAITQGVDLVQLIGPQALIEAGQNADEEANSAFWFSFNIIFLVITIGTAYSLFTIGFMMLARTAWLVVLMIISPLAFVSWFIPSLQGNFQNWFKNIIDKSFCVCVYLFMIYLTLLIVEGTSGADFAARGQSDWKAAFVYVTINVMLIVSMLQIANKNAQKMCEGKFGLGSTISKFAVGTAATVGTAGLGVATGGAGLAARASIGRLGYRMSEGSETLRGSKNAAARALGNTLYGAGRNLQDTKFGLQRGYQEQKAEKAKDRVNTGQVIYNTQRDKEMKALKSQVDSGAMTEEQARQKAGERAATARDAYLNDIGTNSLSGIIDYVAAGGVAAGREAKESQEKINKQELRTQNKQEALSLLQRTIAEFVSTAQNKFQQDGKQIFRTVTNLGAGEAVTDSHINSVKDDVEQAHFTRTVQGDGNIDTIKELNDAQQKRVNGIMKGLRDQLNAEKQYHDEMINKIENNHQQAVDHANTLTDPQEKSRHIQAATIVRDKAIDKATKNFEQETKEIINNTQKLAMEPIKSWQDTERRAIPAKLDNMYEERNVAITELAENLNRDVEPLFQDIGK